MSYKKNIAKSRLNLRLSVIQKVLLLVCGASLFACSGESTISSQNSAVVIEGSVLTSSLNFPLSSSTQVFLDYNHNFIKDENEITTKVNLNSGNFSLSIPALSIDQNQNSFLVAYNDTHNSSSIYLASPLSAFVTPNLEGGFKSSKAVISPLTTLVSGELLQNNLSIEAATSTIQNISYNINPFTNYNEIADNDAKMLSNQIAQKLQPIQKTERDDSIINGFLSATTDVQNQLSKTTFDPNNNETLSNQLSSKANSTNIKPNAITHPNGSNFIVVYKQGVIGTNNLKTNAITKAGIEAYGKQIARRYGGTFKHAYGTAVKGFSLAIPNTKAPDFVTAMEKNPNIDFVEEDLPVYATAITQPAPSWGLDRIDQFALPLSGAYNYTFDGTGINAYVVDTGILPTHSEFTGRVTLPGFSSIDDGRGISDCNGHGTHVAGTLGGTTYGVAKRVNIIPVRVLDCNGGGSVSGLLAGIDWVSTNGIRPAVINLSLGSSASNALDQAVTNAYNAGFVVVAAAGNINIDACRTSPGRAPNVITVGSVTDADQRSFFSNYGVCLDIFAPGSFITSAWFSDNNAINTISGTSMASPHVAGVAALYLQAKPNAAPLEITDAIANSATGNLTGNLGSSSPNRLLRITNTPDYRTSEPPVYMPPIQGPVVPTPAPPTPVPPPKIQFRVLAVKNITASRVKVKKTWTTTVTVSAKSINGGPIQSALIKGNFSIGGVNLVCTTASNGICTIKSGIISTTKTSTNFTITSIEGENLSYLKRSNKLSVLKIKRP
jgi:subtilisin family serine protease